MFPPEVRDQKSMEAFLRVQKVWKSVISRYPDRLLPVRSSEEMERCFREKRQDFADYRGRGRLRAGTVQRTEGFDLGVRLITLTWNYENAFGIPNGNEGGLKPLGIEAVEEMNRLGILVDVSHLSDDGFWDVQKHSKRPFLASHSNARAVTGHQRNLTDDMIRAVAQAGGVIGLNFAPAFLGGEEESRVSDMVRHVLHIREKGGAEVLALGSDFDGIRGKLEIDGPDKFELLWEALCRAGLSETELEGMWHGNGERLLADVLPGSCV